MSGLFRKTFLYSGDLLLASWHTTIQIYCNVTRALFKLIAKQVEVVIFTPFVLISGSRTISQVSGKVGDEDRRLEHKCLVSKFCRAVQFDK